MMLVLFMIKQTQDHVFPRSSRFLSTTFQVYWGFRPVSSLLAVKCSKRGSDGKESFSNVGDPGSIPGLGRSPGEGNGNSLQYSCLDNLMDFPPMEEPGRL